MRLPPRHQHGKPRRLGRIHVPQQHIGAGASQRMGHQHFGIEPRGAAGGGEGLCGLEQRLADGLCAASTTPNPLL
jgi:hypothetical protein